MTDAQYKIMFKTIKQEQMTLEQVTYVVNAWIKMNFIQEHICEQEMLNIICKNEEPSKNAEEALIEIFDLEENEESCLIAKGQLSMYEFGVEDRK